MLNCYIILMVVRSAVGSTRSIIIIISGSTHTPICLLALIHLIFVLRFNSLIRDLYRILSLPFTAVFACTLMLRCITPPHSRAFVLPTTSLYGHLDCHHFMLSIELHKFVLGI